MDTHMHVLSEYQYFSKLILMIVENSS